MVGGEKDNSQKLGVWQKAELADREIQFLPLYYTQSNNLKDKIPDIIKYTAALFRHNLASDFMHFHRLEPSTGKHTFKRLSKRSHLQDSFKIRMARNQIPVCFVAFDIVERNSLSFCSVPLIERKSILKNTIQDRLGLLQKTAFISEHGQAFYGDILGQGLEGVMAKNKQRGSCLHREFEENSFVEAVLKM